MDDHYVADVRNGLGGLREKPYVLFFSHGGGGRAREPMLRIFRRVGTQVGEMVESQGTPDAVALDKCRALGRELAKAGVAVPPG